MLEKYAPERYTLKNGKTARIVYDEKQPPSVSAVLQHMYDVTEKSQSRRRPHQRHRSPALTRPTSDRDDG
jgi:hypothetical protein